MGGAAAVLRGAEDLTREWLAGTLSSGPVESFAVEPIGTGQMSDTQRVSVVYASGADAGPSTVVLKTASADEKSRATGVGLGVYEREIRFYQELAPRIGGPLPQCHMAAMDAGEGWFTLVLEDVAPAAQGDQIAGCGIEQAGLAIRELARLHAPLFADPHLAATPWLNQQGILTHATMAQLLAAFLERYGERVEPAHREVCERFVAALDAWNDERPAPLGLVHGDYRLDNLLFGGEDAPRRFVVVDWQTVGCGPVMTDAAYFIAGSLRVEDRRAHEQALLHEYLDALHAHGVRGFGWEECWRGYRRQSFLGILMTVAPAVLVERTERGDEMFLTTLARHAQQVLDLDALELLVEPGAARPPALEPAVLDEGRHAPGQEQLWNESWYFDAISDDERTGVYARIGLYPNLGVCWFTAFICGPARAPVAIVDYSVPLPPEGSLTAAARELLAEHVCVEPLQRFRVRVQALGVQYEDEAAPLRGEAGHPVPAGLELEWTTRGRPYAYRASTRYEIPCSVTGTVQLGGETLELRGVGQRDHSWGVRDWWSADWMWSAGRLEDGTSFHGVEFRLPHMPALGVGYLQGEGGGVRELDRVSAGELVRDDGLIASAQVRYDELVLSVQPLAFGALLLQAPDGRLSRFPRAMCRVRAEDGRAGVGWFEWNRNVRTT